MKRRSLTLLVLAGAVVLVAAAGAVLRWHPWQAAAAAPAAARARFVPISAVSQDLLRSIELISAAGTIELDNATGKWMIVKPAALGVKQGPLDDLLFSIANLSSERVIEEHPKSLAPYGLDNPSVTVRVTLTSGEVRELYLGDLTPAADSYYLMAKGDPRVFTVREHHGTYFHYGIQDLWEGARSPINAGDIAYLRIARQGRTLVELRKTEELYKSDVEFRGTTVSVVYPYAASPKPVDSFFLTDYVKAFGALQAEKAVDANPKDRSRYGLDHPSWELLIRDGTGATLHVMVGRQEGPVLFLQFEKDPAVYAGDPGLVALLDVDPFRFVSKYAAIVKLDNMDSLTITAGAARHVLAIRRASPGSEEGARWLVDGHEVDVKSFKDFYQAAISLQIDSLHTDAAAGTAALSMVFALNTGSIRTFSVLFVPYSQEFYAVTKNGTGDILVNRQQVRVLLQRLEDLAALAAGR